MRRRSFLQVMLYIGAAFGGGSVVAAAASCYDANSPDLPKCDPRYPDNNAGCFDRRASDAGKDGPDAR
jgi:hypothetical protein